MGKLRLSQALRRGVGRKILGLFLVAGVLPVMFTAGLAFSEFDRAAKAKVYDNLHQSAKAYGFDIFTRISTAADKALELSIAIKSATRPTLEDRPYLFNEFEAVWLTSPTGEKIELYGDVGLATVAGLVERDFLAEGGTQMVVASADGEAKFVLMRILKAPDGTETLIAFRLRSERLWGTREEMPYNTEFCVYLTSGLELFCTQRMDVSIHRNASLSPDGQTTDWRKEDVVHTAVAWQLFLAGAFQAPAFDIIASQPRDFALRSNTDFRRVFLPAMALVLLLVGLLSFRMIGQSLDPLRRLTRAAKAFAAGDLASRVGINTDDEFESLGNAFNNMANRLGIQIEMLEATSEIDRLILSGAKIEDVCKAVTDYLMMLTASETVAVITNGAAGSENFAQMVIAHGDLLARDTVQLPNIGSESLYETRFLTLDGSAPEAEPFAEKFVAQGHKFVVAVPVVLRNDLKGILLIGTRDKESIAQEKIDQCADLADRFAVALSSFERERALYAQANFDELTGLPNRQLLKKRLRDLMRKAKSEDDAGALLYLDLDRFKEINDVYGHSVGDMVLRQAAERITNEVSESDVVARLGGDEFVVILPSVANNDVVKATADRLLDRLTEVFSVFDINHFVGASIGIVRFPEDGESVEMLLKNADAAMYRAKDAGRARYEFFNVELNAESRRKIELERDLRTVFAQGGLEVFYQPQFHLDSGALSGAEALLRWNHPIHGYVAANEFVPLAEESDLIIELGRWVIEKTCRDLRQIIDKGLHPGPISINVSARQLRDSRIAGDVIESLRHSGLHPAHLCLEVTETAVAQNRDIAIDVLDSLRKIGIRIAIDDFGTGYSSLSYLQNMPFDEIKIDKSFVDMIGSRTKSDNICTTIIKMSRELGKASIAEGVESQEQIDFLRSSGCDIVQGFFYSRALPFKDFVAFIRKLDFHTQRRKALEVV